MKKAVLWMIAGMMIMGSLKVFASEDVTAGKLDAAAQDSLEADIQAENTEGKIQAGMADLENTKKEIKAIAADVQVQIKELNMIYNLIDEETDSQGIRHAIGMQVPTAETVISEAIAGNDINKARELKAELKDLLVEVRRESKKLLH